jgi:hypothetical protein
MRVSSVGAPLTRSDMPVPRLSNRISRQNDESRSRKGAKLGIAPVKLEMRDVAGNEDEIEGAFAADLVGDVDLAALCVLNVRDFHGEQCPPQSSFCATSENRWAELVSAQTTCSWRGTQSPSLDGRNGRSFLYAPRDRALHCHYGSARTAAPRCASGARRAPQLDLCCHPERWFPVAPTWTFRRSAIRARPTV